MDDATRMESRTPANRTPEKQMHTEFLIECYELVFVVFRITKYTHTHTPYNTNEQTKSSSWLIHFNGLPYVYITSMVGCISPSEKGSQEAKQKVLDRSCNDTVEMDLPIAHVFITF